MLWMMFWINSARAESSMVFVGNSYMQYNSLPVHVGEVLSTSMSGWENTSVISLTAGGLSFADHADRMNQTSSEWQATFAQTHDYFLFQDQSQIPGFPQTETAWQDSVAGLQAMHAQVSVMGGKSMLMLTWGRENGDPQNSVLFENFETMQNRLNEGYIAYASQASTLDNPIYIAPVGPTFATIREEDMDLFGRLYDNDESHPSPLGSTVASLAITASLTGRSVEGLGSDLTESDAFVIANAVDGTVLEEAVGLYPMPWVWSMIPENGLIEDAKMRPLLRIRADQVRDLTVGDGRLWLENGRLQGTTTVDEKGDFRIVGGRQVGPVIGDVEIRSGKLRLTTVSGDVLQMGGEIWLDAEESVIEGMATLTFLQLNADFEEAYLQVGGLDATQLMVGDGLDWAEVETNRIHLYRVPEVVDTATTEPSVEDTDVEEEKTGCAGVGLWLLLPIGFYGRRRFSL